MQITSSNALSSANSFSYFDANKDGEITEDDLKVLSGDDNIFDANEVKTMTKTVTGQDYSSENAPTFDCAGLLKALDINGNGSISEDDFSELAGKDGEVDLRPFNCVTSQAAINTVINEMEKTYDEMIAIAQKVLDDPTASQSAKSSATMSIKKATNDKNEALQMGYISTQESTQEIDHLVSMEDRQNTLKSFYKVA